MNKILHLKGQFNKQSNKNIPGYRKLPAGQSVKMAHLLDLRSQLQKVLGYWQRDNTINGALVSVYYQHIVAKSNRIRGLLCQGCKDSNDPIRGSKFYGHDPIQHVFTYYVSLDVIEKSINWLEIVGNFIGENFAGEISDLQLEDIAKRKGAYKCEGLAKTNFINVVVDSYYVDKFSIDRDTDETNESSIVTIYKTDIKTIELMDKLGIDMIEAKMVDETTLRLSPDELRLLKGKAPYLIAMEVHDLREILPEDIEGYDPRIVQIPPPNEEPTIGVIDTLFCEDVYFKEWVTYTNLIDENIETSAKDYYHGTAVTSIIVDGPTINPDLDDGCGRFRVRHFGVATDGPFSAFTILKSIREIIASNSDIKVWNLSLGSALEINRNFISPEAAELDKLQTEYDIVFVVAGTNKKDGEGIKRIGAPADSLNSIIVNAVDFNDQPASYHRVGPVLSFFHKPDVSYYGGDKTNKIKVCTPTGEGITSGTSFAAPWITRKVAFLIYHMGFTREIAKALIIDSAAAWDRKDRVSHSIGYGIVPKRIEEIVQSPNDEIRFIITGSSDAYETYNYNIPIPIHQDKHPFYARATLCYFPKCSRNQGVDYTSTEMDFHFGRVTENKNGSTTIKAIDDNRQGDEGFQLIYEENARKFYRKWDNIKLVHETIRERTIPRKTYASGMWGISIKTKERLRDKNGLGMQFGLVITLKDMHGENRIDDFIKRCMVRGWIVNQIDVESRVDLYIKAEEELIFEG